MAGEGVILSDSILLVRRDLEGLPPPVPPPGFAVRTYREGDASVWTGIIGEAFPEFEWDEAKFEARFLQKPQFVQDRLFFVTRDPDDCPVGTAMAWVEDPKALDSGCVHWVAVLPSHQRRGIGRFLTLKVLEKFKALGLPKAHLWTERYRDGAIRMYEQLGFNRTDRNGT